MEGLKERIIDFMAGHIPEYLNPHGVVIMLHEDLSVYVQVKFPGHRHENDICLDIIRWFDSLEEFFDAFEIKDFMGLGRIKLSVLEKMYSRGLAQIYCLVGDYELTFQKKGNSMEVSDDSGYFHKLKGLLGEAEEFVDYTRQYYKLEKTYPD